ncbi:MAG: MIP/aquaporin family protein [Bacteroidota bacterium]
MNALVAEFIGTTILLLLGNGVVANVVLKDTKGNDSGLVVIALAWGLAVFVGVFITADFSGAHLNPAVSIGLATAGSFTWSSVPGYIAAQCGGAMLGTTLVWLMYRPHYESTEDPGAILASFANTPAIKDTLSNFLSEFLGTFVLVYAVLHIVGATVGDQEASLGSLDALPVALVVVVIGMSLGGTTGYAINPARDLGPRIMHTILPISHKGSSAWWYAWLPVIAPIAGGVAAGLLKVVIG